MAPFKKLNSKKSGSSDLMNIKSTNLIKNNSVTTHFSIGKDQILHFDFDLGDINNDELDSILASIKNKKKKDDKRGT